MRYSRTGKRSGPMVIGIILILAGIAIPFINRKWVRNVIEGPTPITLSELRKLEDPATLANQWVRFTFDHAVETDVRITTQSRGRTSSRSRFLLIQVEDRWLMADVPEDFSGNQITGELEIWWVPLRKETMNTIKERFPSHPTLPFQIDAEYDQQSQCYAMLGLSAFALVFGAYLLMVPREPTG